MIYVLSSLLDHMSSTKGSVGGRLGWAVLVVVLIKAAYLLQVS